MWHIFKPDVCSLCAGEEKITNSITTNYESNEEERTGEDDSKQREGDQEVEREGATM